MENYTTSEALIFYESLTLSLRHSQSRILKLEAKLEVHDNQATEDYDELHSQWESCYAKKTEEIKTLKLDLEVSYKLPQSSKATIRAQEDKLLNLQQIQIQLTDRERTFLVQKQQLRRWEGQARAMLGDGATSNRGDASANFDRFIPISKSQDGAASNKGDAPSYLRPSTKAQDGANPIVAARVVVGTQQTKTQTQTQTASQMVQNGGKNRAHRPSDEALGKIFK